MNGSTSSLPPRTEPWLLSWPFGKEQTRAQAPLSSHLLREEEEGRVLSPKYTTQKSHSLLPVINKLEGGERLGVFLPNGGPSPQEEISGVGCNAPNNGFLLISSHLPFLSKTISFLCSVSWSLELYIGWEYSLSHVGWHLRDFHMFMAMANGLLNG